MALSHLGFIFGCLAYFFMGVKRRHMQNNYLALGFTSAQALRLSITSLGNYGRLLTEFARLSSIDNATIQSWGIRRQALIQRAYAAGRGVVLATFHLGNWDLAGCAVGVAGYPLAVIADSVGPPWLNQYVVQARTAKGMRVLPTSNATRMIDSALEQKQGVAFLVDRPMARGGVAVRFAGRTLRIPKGAMYYARKWNAVLLIGYALRLSANSFAPTVACEIPVLKTADLDDDLRNMGQQIMDEYERLVRQHPEQWYMFRPLGAT